MPVLVSAALVSVAVMRVSPERLANEAARLNWPPLVGLTIAFVLALYFADAACLRWLFSQPDLRLSYWSALHARGSSYLFSAVNYGLGQAVLAWNFASSLKLPLIGALGRLAVLLCHDMVVLLSMGLVASLFSTDPRVQGIRLFCAMALAIIGLAIIAACFLPMSLRERLRQTKWGVFFSWWTLRRSLRLCLVRFGYFSIIIVYATLGLALCEVMVDEGVVFTVIPIVVLIEGLPISVSGLGTRETTLTLLLNVEQDSAVVAFSLIWSTGLIVGRLLLGLGHWWLPRIIRSQV
jgi:hypothetical protein